jgi:hypothetical protein
VTRLFPHGPTAHRVLRTDAGADVSGARLRLRAEEGADRTVDRAILTVDLPRTRRPQLTSPS